MTIQNAPKTAEVRAVLETALELCKGLNLEAADAAELVPLIKAVQAVAAYSTAVHAQIEVRALTNNQPVPGAAVKDEVKHRVWNDEETVTSLAREQFGDKAFSCKLLSPAGIEKLGSEGKALVAMCSHKPEAGKKVVY